jgi:ABC-type multidrug transport system ATPase subunit
MIGEYQYDIMEKVLFVIVKKLIPYNPYIYNVLFASLPSVLKELIISLQDLTDRMADNRGYEKIMAIEPIDDSFYTQLYSESDILFQVEGLCKRYGDVIVFDNASVILPSRRWISFLGNSGGGKSTFSRMILAKERHDSGNILFQGKHSNYNYKNIRDSVSYAKNKDDLFNNSIFYNLTYGVKIEKKAIEQIRYYFKLFGIEKIDLKANINTLSSGQQQRIKVIRMIIEDKPIWILDESTSNIDNAMENIVVSELRRIQKEKNKSVLHITHNVENTLIADMVMRIEDSKLVIS